MRNAIGFDTSPKDENALVPQPENGMADPVRSVVEVYFIGDGRTFPYYNDRFDLKVGDVVFVSGKLAGKMGIVKSVTAKFKVDLSYYKKVVSRPEFRLSGTFAPIAGMMVSFDGGAAPDAGLFREWVKPPLPDDTEHEVVYGEGYAFCLEKFHLDEDVDPDVFSRAIRYCEEGKVRFLSLKDGVGTAFVEGSVWYEVNFRYCGGRISDMYCDCAYPGLCKHNLAALILLRALGEQFGGDDIPDFTAVEQSFFFKMLSVSRQSVTV